MSIKKNISRKSILVSWMFSYVSVLLIPVIISIFVYFSTYRVVENEINTTNTTLLKQVQQSFDERLSEVEKLCLQINFNARVQELYFSNKLQLNPDIHYKLYEVSKDFKTYMASTSYIDDFYLYVDKLDFVVSPDTVCDSKTFYRTYYNSEKMTFDEWHQMMQQKHYKNYRTINRAKDHVGEVKSLAIAQSLPMQITDYYNATIIITFNEHYFIEFIKNIEWINKGFMFILSGNNEVLVSTGDIAVKPPIEYSNLDKQYDILTHRFNNEDVTISYISSEVSDLKYISVIPSTVFKQKGQYVQRITIFSVFLCLILGGIISYYFVKKNYIPVNELLHILKSKAGITRDKKYNEYNFIREAISSTINEKKKSDEWVKQQKISLRSNLLGKLLKGQTREYPNIYEALSRFDIEFISNNFCVMQFYIDKYEELQNKGVPEDNIKLAKFIVSNVVGELIEQRHRCYFTEVNDILLCIINFNGPIDNDISAELHKVAKEASSFIYEKFKILFSISISNIHNTLDGITTAYTESIEAMEYKIITGKGSIISYSELINTGTCYEYHVETERQLVNYVKSGDYENAKMTLHNILCDNLYNKGLTAKMAKCMIFDLISTVVKITNEIGQENSDNISGSTKTLDILFSCETIGEMESHLNSILKSICCHVQDKKKSHNYKLKNDIIKEVESNYHDINLCVSTIADKFSLAPNYLSSYFKEQTGYGLSDFITKVRIEKAKELLISEKETIGKVAKKAGFYDSNGFIRTFKKHEGITPGLYKEIHTEAKAETAF